MSGRSSGPSNTAAEVQDKYASSTWLAMGIGERIAHHLQVTALLREQGKTKEAAELDERFNERLAWEMS